MTDTLRKRAERQRKTAAGYKRVECWLSAEDVAWAKQVATDNGDALADVVAWCVTGTRTEFEK